MLLSKNIVRMIFFMLIAAWSIDAHAVDRSSIRNLAKSILENPSFQKKLVKAPALEPESHGCGGPRSVKRVKTHRRVGVSLFSLLAWLGVGVALAMAGIWIAAWVRRKNLVKHATRQGQDATAPSEDRLDLAKVQHLASMERFAEAVHWLFLTTVSKMAEENKRTIFSWMTSRELSMTLPTGDKEREAFSRLVKTVEAGLFAGRNLGKSDYERCLQDYEFLVGEY